jgi:hypothetical protein
MSVVCAVILDGLYDSLPPPHVMFPWVRCPEGRRNDEIRDSPQDEDDQNDHHETGIDPPFSHCKILLQDFGKSLIGEYAAATLAEAA